MQDIFPVVADYPDYMMYDRACFVNAAIQQGVCCRNTVHMPCILVSVLRMIGMLLTHVKICRAIM